MGRISLLLRVLKQQSDGIRECIPSVPSSQCMPAHLRSRSNFSSAPSTVRFYAFSAKSPFLHHCKTHAIRVLDAQYKLTCSPLGQQVIE
jgi:hypothetical protein